MSRRTLRLTQNDWDTSSLIEAWRRLVNESRCYPAFSGPTWFKETLRHYPDQEPVVLAHYDGERLEGLFPLVCRTLPEGRRYAFPAERFTEWMDLIVSETGPVEVDGDLLRSLLDLLEAGDAVHLLNLDIHSRILAAVLVKVEEIKQSFEVWARVRFQAPYVEIEGSYASYLEKKSGAFRKDVVRGLKKFESRGLRVVSIQDARISHGRLSDFFVTSVRERFEEKSVFSMNSGVEFIRDAIAKLLEEGLMDGFVVLSNDQALQAVSLEVHRMGSERLAYQDGYHLDLREIGISKCLYALGLQRAIEAGCTAYDFSRIPNTLKDRFKTAERPSYELWIRKK